MKLTELSAAVEQAKADMDAQDKYVQSLGIKIQNGVKTIDVFADNVWTTVKLDEFWKVQYNKYLAMSGYAGDLDGLEKNLQAALDSAMQSIPTPDQRTIEQAKAK